MSKPAPALKTDRVNLPSGAVVDLLSLNIGACRTPDDAFELLQNIQEKIIEIEHQIEMHDAGYHPDGRRWSPEDPPSAIWLAKAKKAIAWSKLQKADAQYRLSKLQKAENENRLRELNRAFVDSARALLDGDTFQRILYRASAIAGQEVGSP